MERRGDRAAAARPRRKSRKMTYIWVAVVTGVVFALLLTEQLALLYVLATLSMAVLFVIVAVSDLRGSRQAANVPAAPYDDAAAISDGVSGAGPTTTFGSTTTRTVKRRG